MDKVGIERDKRIAELMGWVVKERIINRRGWDCTVECESKTEKQIASYGWHRRERYSEDGRQWKAIKPYSTSIAHAMELWDEMKEAGEHPCLGVRVDGWIFCNTMTDRLKVENDTIGENEADAISGAWLKWKEADNG